MKHRLLTICMLGAAALGATAHEGDEYLRLKADARIDYQRDWTDAHSVDSHSGFEGKYLNVQLDGMIVPGLTYSWRQRFNKASLDAGFFNATDWIYLDYAVKGWSFSAGKQVVAIGGWEYDRAPIDLYSCSVFWNNIPCYDMGASVAYNVSPTDQLKLQVVQSPFYTADNKDMYAYNLFWSATHGCWKPLWSVNMIEYANGRYINYIALGNKFTFNKVSIELDYMNRAASHQTFMFRDCSVMAEVSWRPNHRWNLFAKATYDVNHSGTDSDYTVLDGTELKMAGAGAEFYPLRKHNMDLRLHADLFYAWGKNANTADLMQNKTMILNVGVKWNMNLVSIKRKH